MLLCILLKGRASGVTLCRRRLSCSTTAAATCFRSPSSGSSPSVSLCILCFMLCPCLSLVMAYSSTSPPSVQVALLGLSIETFTVTMPVERDVNV